MSIEEVWRKGVEEGGRGGGGGQPNGVPTCVKAKRIYHCQRKVVCNNGIFIISHSIRILLDIFRKVVVRGGCTYSYSTVKSINERNVSF
jgi:hypothetical protein